MSINNAISIQWYLHILQLFPTIIADAPHTVTK